MIKTVVKVKGSTNGISNKYKINKSSSFYSTSVGYTIRLAMKVPSIFCTKCYTTQI
jgi:phage protein D